MRWFDNRQQYARLETGTHQSTYRICTIGAILLFAMVSFFVLSTAATTEIRLDTGDTRTTLFGVEVSRSRMQVETRTKLLSLKNDETRDRWIRLGAGYEGRKRGSIYGVYYRESVAWIDVDTKIAAVVAEDMAMCIEHRDDGKAPMDVGCMLWPLVESRDGGKTYVVSDRWSSDPFVIRYLRRHGLDTITR